MASHKLRKLNKFIQFHHFKFETLDSVLSGMKRNSFLVSIELKNAYLSIPVAFEQIHIESNGIFYHCNALIFGLASAPRVFFTKIMKTEFAHLRQQGISSF